MVVAKILEQAIGDQVHPIFVDNGLLRQNEAEQVRAAFKEHFSIPLHFVDAGEQFLKEGLRFVVDKINSNKDKPKAKKN